MRYERVVALMALALVTSVLAAAPGSAQVDPQPRLTGPWNLEIVVETPAPDVQDFALEVNAWNFGSDTFDPPDRVDRFVFDTDTASEPPASVVIPYGAGVEVVFVDLIGGTGDAPGWDGFGFGTVCDADFSTNPSNNGFGINLSVRTSEFVSAPGDVRCVLSTEPSGVGGGIIDVHIDGGGAGRFQLGNTIVFLADDGPGGFPSSFQFTNVPDSFYTLRPLFTIGADTLAPGTVTGSSCDDPGGNTAVDGPDAFLISMDGTETITCTYTIDGGSGAGTGTITVVKDAIPDGPQDFSFTGDLGDFTLDDDDDPTLDNTVIFPLLPPDTYRIEEIVPDGWSYDVECTGHDDDGSAAIDIILEAGDDITCTYTNTDQSLGMIVVVKDAIPDGPQDFSFTGDLGDFTLDDDDDPTLPNTLIFPFLEAGNYLIEEVVPPGWTAEIDCGDVPTNGSPAFPEAIEVVLGPGDLVTCTAINRDESFGTITIVKDSVPDRARDFRFTGDLGEFSLDDDRDPTLDNTVTFGGLEPGGYQVAEALPNGWDLSIECDDDDSNTEGLANTAGIIVSAGEHVTCTFTNTKRATIEIVKDSIPDDPQSFEFAGDLGLFALDDDDDPILNSAQTFSVPPGTYTVRENRQAGWRLTALTCDPQEPVSVEGRSATIVAAPGQHIRCTFENTKLARLTIEKTTDVPTTERFGMQLLGREVPISLILSGLSSVGAVASQSRWLTPGSATLMEGLGGALEQWRLDSVVCDGEPVAIDASDRTRPRVAITLEAGRHHTCRLHNVSQSGEIVIVKDAIPDSSQDFSFYGDLGDFRLDDDDADDFLSNIATWDVEAGEYVISERPRSGWDVDIACDDDDSSATAPVASSSARVVVGAGETVTCVFTNTRRGTVIITKDAIPDGPQEFSFTGDLGAFRLTDDEDASALGRTETFDVRPGDYTVIEHVPPGWDVSVSCDDDDSEVDGSVGVVTAVVSPGETVRCSFVNTELATVTIVKDAIPNSPRDFSFGLFPAAGELASVREFVLDDDRDPTLPSSRVFEVTPGDYVIEESAVQGWTLSDIGCDTDAEVSGGAVMVALDPGADVVCWFENRRLSRLTIQKTWDVPTYAEASFSSDAFVSSFDLAGTFQIDEVTTATRWIEPGDHAVFERSDASTWRLESVTCDGEPREFEPTADDSNRIDISLTPGQRMTCRFHNEHLRGSIVIVKDAVPDHPQDFDFVASHGDGEFSPGSLGLFSLDDDATDGALRRVKRFVDILPGRYLIDEIVPPGWESSVRCADPDGGTETAASRATIDLDHGETVRCVFTNTQEPGTIFIAVAEAGVVGESRFESVFEFDGDLGEFSLGLESLGRLKRYREAFDGLQPGTYAVSQMAQPGWVLKRIRCTDPDGGTEVLGATATIDLDPGEVVRCVYVNKVDPVGSITIIKDAVPDGPGDYRFTLAAGGQVLTEVELDDDADPSLANRHTFTRLPIRTGASHGTYRLTEDVLPDGWSLADIACDGDLLVPFDGSSPILAREVDIELTDPGQHVTCTFTNFRNDHTEIVIEKAGLEGSTQVFEFDAPADIGAFTLDNHPATSTPAARTFADLDPGPYVISEIVPDGWGAVGIECSDPDGGTLPRDESSVLVDLDAGERVHCVFMNQPLTGGTVQVVKVVPSGVGQDFEFRLSSRLGPFLLDGTKGSAPPRSRVFDVPPGELQVTESSVDGWSVRRIRCSGMTGEARVDLEQGTVAVFVDVGDVIRCVFVNVPTCDGLRATIVGTDGNDTLVGTDGRDVIWAGPGADRVDAGAGVDVVCGGDGDDVIDGGRGADRLFGEKGRDRILGRAGPDHIDGGPNSDTANGGVGADTCLAVERVIIC